MKKLPRKKTPSQLNLKDHETPIKKETCFNVYKTFCVNCEFTECRYWQDMKGKYQNCVINAAAEGPHTLQEIGDIFSVTRMRICQIEKSAKESLKSCIDEDVF